MSQDQDQNQKPLPGKAPAPGALKPEEPYEKNIDLLKKKIAEGQKIAEEQQKEGKVPSPEVSSKEQKPVSLEIKPPFREAKPSPPPPGEPVAEHPLVTWQREKAKGALGKQKGEEAKLEEVKSEARDLQKEVAKEATQIEKQAELAAGRVEKGKPLATEAAGRAQIPAEKIEKATQDLREEARRAKVQEKRVASAREAASREIKTYEALKKLDPYSQKQALQEQREKQKGQ